MQIKKCRIKARAVFALTLVLALLLAPLDGFVFAQEALTNIGVTKTVRAADTGFKEYPYFNNEPSLGSEDRDLQLGSAENPLEIATADQLYNLYYVCSINEVNPNYSNLSGDVYTSVNYATCYYKVVADIDLSLVSEDTEQSNTDWKPIGQMNYSSSSEPFQGVFDGGNTATAENPDGFTISNMKIENASDFSYTGLFGYIVNGATVKNVTLKDASITGTTGTKSEGCSFIVGRASHGVDTPATISDCHVINSNMNVTSTAFYPSTTDTDSYGDTAILPSQYSVISSGFGGILGIGDGVISISSSSTEGSTVQCEGIKQVGGIAGRIPQGTVTNCTNNSTVTGTMSVGGIGGVLDSVTVQSCTNKAAVKGAEWSYDMWSALDAGITNPSGGHNPLSSEASLYNDFAPATCVGGIAGRSGGEITYCQNLGAIQGYEVCGGIVGGSVGSIMFCMNQGNVSYMGNTDKTYTNLITEDGTISNTFTNTAYPDGVTMIPRGISIGGIAGAFGFFQYTSGVQEKQITVCGNTGTISGIDYVAGILGNRHYNDEIASSGEASEELAQTPVISSYNVGEITLDTSAAITASSSVTSRNLVSDDQPFENSYYLAEAESDEEPYGRTESQFVSGQVAWEMSCVEDVNNNYWRQKIGEDNYPSSLQEPAADAQDNVYKVTFLPYDSEDTRDYSALNPYINYEHAIDASVLSDTYYYDFYYAEDSGDGEYIPTDDYVSTIVEDSVVMIKATLAPTWGRYPYFDNEPAEVGSASDLGSKENPLKIVNAEQLYNLSFVCGEGVDNENNGNSPYYSCYYEITEDIDLSTCDATKEEWTPIGGLYGFRGGIDGKEHAISNMKITHAENRIGLFDYVSDSSGVGYIKNITISQAVINVTMTSEGYEDMYNPETAAMLRGAGFLAGQVYGNVGNPVPITNCDVKDSTLYVESDLFCAGSAVEYTLLSGMREYQDFSENCGGLIGCVSGWATISDCTNAASVVGQGVKNAGGIVGSMDAGQITGCTNSGTISGMMNVGGVSGLVGNVTVTQSVNQGSIAGLEWSHDLWLKVAEQIEQNKTTLSDSVGGTESNFYERFRPATCIGGIVGKNAGYISYCQNAADTTIAGYEFCGGIVGATKQSVNSCMNSGSVIYAGEDYTYENLEGSGEEDTVSSSFEVDGLGTLTLNPSGESFGGIVGSFGLYGFNSADYSQQFLQVKDSGNTGLVRGKDYIAGIVGNRNYNTGDTAMYYTPVVNCYNAGIIMVDADAEVSVSATGKNLISNDQPVENSYYLVTTASAQEPCGRTLAQFRTGQVAWELSNTDGNTNTWTQMIDTDTYPDSLTEASAANERNVYKVTYVAQDINDDTDYTVLTKYVNKNASVVVPDLDTEEYTYTFYVSVKNEDGSFTPSESAIEDMVVTTDSYIGVKRTEVILPTATPTDTPTPSDTSMPEPTDTTKPSDTSTPAPTDTTKPSDTPTPVSTDTPTPNTTQTPIPQSSVAPENLNKGMKVTQDNTNYTVTGDATVSVSGTTKANESASILRIPATITVNGETLKVTAIDNSAFEKQKKLKKVVMGANIETIGKKAFKNCSKLKQVSYSNKVETVGDESFSNCRKLTSVTLPDTTRKIGKKAFYNCKGLKKIKIGKKRSDKKKGLASDIDMGTLINSVAAQTFTQRETVENYSALNVKISVGNSALENCTNLKSVIVNCAVSVIGNSAFKNCTKLSAIIVRSLILKSVGKKALTGVSKCKISVPTKKFAPYRKLFKNKGQGKKVLVAKA